MRSERIEDLDDSRRLELLVDGLSDHAIYLISLDGTVVSWNAGARRLKGYESAEIIGKPYACFFPPEDREKGLPQRGLDTAARTGRYESEGWRIRKDGTRFWGLSVIDAVRNEEGTVIGFAKITRDMTEREAARQRLLESEIRFRRLVESVIDYAIFQLDPDGIVSTWNAGAQRIKGYTAEEIVGRHFSCFYTEPDRAAGMPQRALKMAATEGRFEAEALRVRKDGTVFSAFVVIDPIRDERGEIVGFAKVTRDITDRVKAADALKSAQEQLAAAQRMEAVGQLSGGIAHDFNNLLMIVMGNLETARRYARGFGDTQPNIQRAIDNAMRGAQRATALTSRLLAFARRQPLDPKPIDVNKFLSGSVDFLQRSLGEKIQVEAIGTAGAWHIEADPSHLEAALVNLAINARDAMPGGGKVTIETSNLYIDETYVRANPEMTPGQYVMLSVTDTGEGMAPDVLQRAFEPFFTTKEAGQGTGLGLSQVYGFVKQSGGHVKIYSEAGHGTCVKIYLPRYASDALDEEASLTETIARSDDGETILVVEDDREVRSYLSEVLRGLGYHVLTAPHAEAAIVLLERNVVRVDLMLTDVIMPGKNGRELGRCAEKLRPGMPILYMTGYARNALLHQGRMEEGINLLQKPIAQDRLASRIRDLLDHVRRA